MQRPPSVPPPIIVNPHLPPHMKNVQRLPLIQPLREFIKERLAAVCEEIFSEVQKTIGHYEEEISRQRRLLDISRKPDTNSHMTEEGLDEEQVCNQERSSSLDQEDSEPPQIKEEEEELCSSREGEQLGVKQEAEGIWTDEERLRLLENIWKPEIKSDRIDLQEQHVCEEEGLDEQQVCNKERNSSLDQEDPEAPQIKEEEEELCSSREGEQLGLKQEADAFMGTPTYEESDHSEAEPNNEELLSHSCPEAEKRDQEESQHVDSGPTKNAELRKRKRSQTPTYDEMGHIELEPNSEELLSHSSPETKSRDQEESQHVDSGPTAELKKTRHHRKRSHSQRVRRQPVTESPEPEISRITEEDPENQTFNLDPGSDLSHPEQDRDPIPRLRRTKSEQITSQRNFDSDGPSDSTPTESGEKYIPKISENVDIDSDTEIVDSDSQDLPQQNDCEEEEGLNEQQVCNQERSSSLDQEDPEPPQIKEEEEEVCSSQKGEQLGVKQEAESIIVWTGEERLRLLKTIWKPEIKLRRIGFQHQEILIEQQVCNQERNSSLDQEDPEPPQIKEEEEELCSSQFGLKQEADTLMVTPTYEERVHTESEPNVEQLLSHSTPESKHQDQEENQHVNSGLTRNAELKKRHHGKKNQSQRLNEAPVSESQSETGTRKKSLHCDTCCKTFQYKSQLATHLTLHTGERPYSCSTCGNRFRTNSTLKIHLRSHTGEKPYSCRTCGKRFSLTSTLKTHVRVHTGEKPYLCSACGKQFIQNSDLERHARIHSGEKPYSCRTCGKEFNDRSTLKTHGRVHTGERPFFCSICGKRYIDSSGVIKHMAVHTGEKPYSCCTCGKSFSWKSDFERHVRVHTGEKPHCCSTCGKGFIDLAAFRKHTKTHTIVTP